MALMFNILTVLFSLPEALLLALALVICLLLVRALRSRAVRKGLPSSGYVQPDLAREGTAELQRELLLCQPSTGLEADWVLLYESSFPPEERATLERIRREIVAGKRVLHRTLSPTGELLCFSLLYLFDGFVWLSYLASDPSQRSHGVGSKHLSRLIELLKQQYPQAVGLFFDIESPVQIGLDEETLRLRCRRLKFYQRLGARRMPPAKQYFMPNFVAGEPPIPAELLWFEFGNLPVDSSSDLKRVIRTVYENVYGLAPADPFIERITGQF